VYSSDVIIRDLEIMSGAKNYGEWIFDNVKDHLGKRVVEIGAGIGSFTRKFLDKEFVIAVDSYRPCIEYIKKRFPNNNNIIAVESSVDSPSLLRLSHCNPDTIVCINVLEHIQNDRSALHNMYSILTLGGKLILVVPAFQFIYGTIDRIVGHQRRYSKRDIEEKLLTAGFHIKRISYMNCIAPFGWYLNNRVLRKREESPAQVKFYDRFIVPWLRKVERSFVPPFGLSLVVVGEKLRRLKSYKHK